MAFITKRVVAMGYPSIGCESVYRNKLEDLKNFFAKYEPEYKVYNLCIEDGRIYQKRSFNVVSDNGIMEQKKVGLFPFLDHQPCPIKLMLQLCTDLCLFLIRNPKAVATLHCKAGKGRTGMMIVSYLVFSGLCKTVEEAMQHYGRQRTKNGRGVTIPSQKRYIEYFLAFCHSHFTWPFYRCIPLIKARFLSDTIYNILRDYLNKTDYFYTLNSFHFTSVKVGPFKKKKDAKLEFSSLNCKKMGFEKCTQIITQEGNNYYISIDLRNGPSFNYDVKMTCSAFMFNFYCWFNLYYSTIENLSNHISNIMKISGGKKQSSSADKQTDANSQSLVEEIIDTSSSKGNLLSEENNGTNALTPLEQKKADPSILPDLLKVLKQMNNGFKDEQNLIPMIRMFNDEAITLDIPQFDYKNQKLVLTRPALDKFKDKTNCVDKSTFQVEFRYELEENKKEFIFGEI